MTKLDIPHITNTSKRLPIVFCLDVSPSMSWPVGNSNTTSMDLLNEAVRSFISDLKEDPKASVSAEVAFVTFSTNIEMDSHFESIRTLKLPTLKAVDNGGTQMSTAVLRSIEKLEQRRSELKINEISSYAPFLVLVTDGNPDGNDSVELQRKALKEVRSHCDSKAKVSDIIVPFIVGVGDHISAETLNAYAAGFTNGFFHITGNASSANTKFGKVFKLISNSTKASFKMGGNASNVISTIQNDMDDLLKDLAGM